MICPSCGKENANNFRYCQFCGTALSNSAILKVIENGEPMDALPPSKTSEPGPLDAWLMDEQNTATSTLNGRQPDLDDAWFEDDKADAATDNDVVASEDLPLLDENNASLIPVDISYSGLRINESGNAGETGEPKSQIELSSGLSKLIELNEQNVRHSSNRICPQCGEVIADGHRFCGNCGTRYESGFDYTPATSQTFPNGVRESDAKRTAVERMRFAPGTEDCVPFTVCHINDNGTEGEYIPVVKGENIIGRNTTNALSSDRFINQKHLRLTVTDTHVIVEDFNSLNGVFYRLSDESVILRNGDIFRIGEELLCYFHGATAQPLLTNQSNEQTNLLGGDEAPGWGYLRVVMGAFAEGSVYRLWQPTVSLGRTHANILFPKDGFVSGTHATIKGQKDYAILTDLDSSNGTFVRIKAPLKVAKTTFILIGNQLLRIQPR